jgi:hypothetical protein
MFSRLLIFSLLVTVSLSLQAQYGSVTGKVLEQGSDFPLPGVNVYIEGTTLGASTSLDGEYTLRNIPSGDYTLVCSFLGYDTQKVPVTIKNTETTTIDFTLSEATLLIGEAEVIVTRSTNTENAVLLETKNARQVVSGISRQQIQNSQDDNAAQVMQRVPGVTIVDNRFVMIRGVSERYNQVMINNVIAPSTEVDRRTFSFDLIGSSAIDRMMIFKTGTPEHPGDFAGGVIKIYTVNAVEEEFTNASVSLGFRQATTFNEFFMSEKSPTDLLGFDNGFRGLPGDFPSTRRFQSEPRNSEARRIAAHSLPNNWNPTAGSAMPDYAFGVSLGRIGRLGDKRLTSITNIGYSHSFQYFAREFNRYDEWVNQDDPIFVRFAFVDDTFQETNKINIMSNWSLELDKNNKLRFSNFFSQIGENQTIIRNGQDFIQRPTDDLRNYLLSYRARTIYSGQLEGIHNLASNKKLDWVLGGSYLGESQPDLRRFRTFRPQDSDDAGFLMQLPPSSNLFETGRFYGDLNEFSVNNGLDFTYFMPAKDREDPDAKGIELKTGYYVDYRDRDFSSRYFSYLYPGFFDPVIGQEIIRLPLDEVFSNENVRTTDGLVLEEGTRPIDAYQATNFLTAAYGSAVVPLGKVELAGGMRAEYNIQTMTSRDDFEVIEVNNPILSLLPFVNATWSVGENAVIRGGYGRTVNRPEFRELAPFLFYDYELEAGRIGNPDLQVATIDNLDLRYEVYPRIGETFSFGVFYKRFTNPIENRTIITTESPQFTYINADFATNYGAEIEFRKSLSGVTESKFLDNLGFNINASYIFSEVDLGETALAQDRVRPLQGQSPYIINAGTFYQDEQKQFSVHVYYNIFGTRIFSVGDVLFPTIYELPRQSLDLTVSKQVSERVNLKAGIQDLLNFQYRFYQDSNRDGVIDTDVDHLVFGFRRGRLFTFDLTFNLHKSVK